MKENSSDKMIPLINNSPDLIASKLNNSNSSSLSGITNDSKNSDKSKNEKKTDSYKRKKSFEKLTISDDKFPNINGVLNLNESNNNKRKSSPKKEVKSLILEEENEKSVETPKKKEEITNNIIIVKDNEKKENINVNKDELIDETVYNKKSDTEINNDISNNTSYLDGNLIKKEEERKNLIIKHPLMDKSNYSKEPFESQKIGFTNIGNTCYMNSFLQILLHTPGFLNELKKEGKNKSELIDNLISLSEDPYNTKYLKNIKQKMGEIKETYGRINYQSDSQEFGIDLINDIINSIKGELSFSDESDSEEEQITSKNIGSIKKSKFEKYINKYYNENNEISLEKMFQFHMSKIEIGSKENNEITKINRIKFETCINIDLDFLKYKKADLMELLENKYKDYLYKTNNDDIHLFINDKNKNLNEQNNLKKNLSKKNDNNKTTKQKTCLDSILDLLKFLFWGCYKAQTDEEEEEDNNNIEDNKEDYINLIKLASLPKILIISINRAFLGKKFNDNIISYKEILDVNKFIDQDILKKERTKYRLFAVNECCAHRKESGHYYSYIKINNKTWYKFNDNHVSEDEPNLSSEYVVGLYYIKDE